MLPRYSQNLTVSKNSHTYAVLSSSAIPKMPLHSLLDFSPFRIDALGLVTLIGAEEVNRTVGRLSSSRYTKFLPLLGAYLIASNQFTSNQSGYQLYNVTDGITTNAVSGWFSRWLDTQEVKDSGSAFEWRVRREKRTGSWDTLIAAGIASFLIGGLLALSILMGDWFGLANACSMAASVLVRWTLVEENVDGLNIAAVATMGKKGMRQRVKLLITLANGRIVTIYAPRGLVIAGFTKRIEPVRKAVYQWGKRAGWFFFGVHITTLGQSDLVSQLYTVFLLVLSTWATVHGVGSEEGSIGEWIENEEVEEYQSCEPRRRTAYAKLRCTPEEEDSLMLWGLLPHKSNKAWWEEYEACKALEMGLQSQRDSKEYVKVREKSLSGSSTMSDESQ